MDFSPGNLAISLLPIKEVQEGEMMVGSESGFEFANMMNFFGQADT